MFMVRGLTVMVMV